MWRHNMFSNECIGGLSFSPSFGIQVRLGWFHAQLSTSADRELKILRELIARAHHRVAPAEDAARSLVPGRVAIEEQIAVPQRVGLLREFAVAAARRPKRRQSREKPAARSLRFIPPMLDARVGQQLARPFRFRVAGIHPEPDREHANVGLRILVEQLALRPTGASHAGGSRRRQQKDQPRMTLAGIEPGLELVDAAKTGESNTRRLGSGRCRQKRRERHDHERQSLHAFRPLTMKFVIDVKNDPARTTASRCASHAAPSSGVTAPAASARRTMRAKSYSASNAPKPGSTTAPAPTDPSTNPPFGDSPEPAHP